MTESGGDVLVTDNAPADAAIEMFSELEGVDIEPAAGVALACLRAAAADGRIPRTSRVLLNVTGGGRDKLERDHVLIPAVPDLYLPEEALALPKSVNRTSELFASAVPA